MEESHHHNPDMEAGPPVGDDGEDEKQLKWRPGRQWVMTVQKEDENQLETTVETRKADDRRGGVPPLPSVEADGNVAAAPRSP